MNQIFKSINDNIYNNEISGSINNNEIFRSINDNIYNNEISGSINNNEPNI